LFAVSFPIQEHSQKVDWNYQLSHVYLVAILDFEYDEKEEKKKFERYVQLKDQDGEVFYNKLHFKFLQMPLFTKTENELVTRYDKWCYFLKNLATMEDIPQILQEPIFEKAFHTSAIGAMNRNEYDIYTSSLMSYWDSKGSIDTAFEKGEQIGLEKGEQIGLEKGKEIGLEEGLEKGRESTIQIIKLFLEGKSILEISNITGISIEVIQTIISEFNS